MDLIVERPQLVAYFAGTIFPLTCFLSYLLALALNHIQPLITYISDASTDPPVSGVFGMFLTYSMLSFGAVTFLRHKFVHHVCEIWPEIASPKVRLSNNISGWLAFISVICLIFVAHFQVSTSTILHGTTAFVGIGLGVIYCCLQVICTRAMVPEYSSPAIFYLRLILAVLSIVAFLFGVLTALLSIAKFRGEKLHRWTPEDGGYAEHAVSSVCEWVLAVVYAAYIMSFAYEFKHLRITPIKVSCVPAPSVKAPREDNGI